MNDKIKSKMEQAKIKTNNKIGPEKFSRDENGLLEAINYEFNEDGSVNWRAMIGEGHLFPNKSWFECRKKDVPTTIDGLKDYQLLIKLSGIKELAKLRGFTDVYYDMEKCEENHVAVKCAITFAPNYETQGQPVVFSDMANATLNNTSSFATKFLETIACNRAFVRCVRNFLNVHIVGDDEIDKSNSKGLAIVTQTDGSSLGLTPTEILKNQCSKTLKCADFQCFKEKLRFFWEEGLYQNLEAKEWSDYEDIPAKEARILLKVIKSL